MANPGCHACEVAGRVAATSTATTAAAAAALAASAPFVTTTSLAAPAATLAGAIPNVVIAIAMASTRCCMGSMGRARPTAEELPAVAEPQ